MRTPSAIAGLIVLSSIGLAACAADQERYPSLTIAEARAQRVSGTLSPMGSARFPDPAQSAEPLPESLDERLAALGEAGEEAQRAFASASADAARLAEAARGASALSERWMRAQLALAELTSLRSETRLALADIDLIAASAQIALPGDREAREIAATQTRLAGYVAEQSRVLAELYAILGA